MFLQVHDGRHDFGDSRLVVCTQQSLAVGYNEVFALMLEQFRELCWCQDDAFFFAKHNVRAVVFMHDTRCYIGPAHIRTGIHVSDEADGRHLLVGIGRKSGIQIAMLVQFYFFQAQVFQFIFQVLCKHHLLGRAWGYTTVFVRLCVEAYIF